MKKVVFLVMMVLIASLVLSGCRKANGGGWLESVVPGEKATFAFNVKCDKDRSGGHIQYNDHGTGFKVHAVLEPDDCPNPDSDAIAVIGTYADADGEGEVAFLAGDLPFGSPGNEVFIIVTGDKVYTHGGPLLGGNIKLHK